MAVGLAALLTVVVAASFPALRSIAVLAAVLGLGAVILGVIALVMRQRALPPVVGLASGVAAILAALVLGMVALGSLFAGGIANGGSGEATGTPDATQAPSPTQPQSPGGAEDAVAWPQNMATGGIVFAGPDATVRTSKAPADNAFPEPLTAAELDAPALVRIYVDYRCPYCARFEEANAETLGEVLKQDAAAIELTSLTFLDRVSEGSYYSSRAAGAMACLAEAQPEAAWRANAALMSPDFQPAEGGPGPDNAAVIAQIERVAGPLNSATTSCITGEAYVPFAQALNEWIFANPVPHAKDPELAVTGTPFVLVDGVPFEGDPVDSKAFRAFLIEQGVALK